MTERVIALAVLLASGAYLAYAFPLARGTAARPGPGFFPLAVGVFACATALVWIVLTFRRQRPMAASVVAGAQGRGRVIATAVTLVGFCLLLPWAGYPLVAFAFVGFLLRRLGAGWQAAVATALVSAGASYYLFAALLGVPLPRGAWFD